MRLKTWLVAALGLGSLVALIAFSMVTSSRKAEAIYAQLDQLNVHHQRADNLLRRLRSDVNLSGIFVRDYLLDVARDRAAEYREELTEFRRANMATGRRASNEAGRLLGHVRSPVRVDAVREGRAERRVPAARGGAAPRCGADHRAGDRAVE